MIQYSVDSIFDSQAEALVCPVNTRGVMGAGLAVEFRRRWPRLCDGYIHACHNGDFAIGGLVVMRPATHQPDDKTLIFLATKEDWRRPARLDYVEAGIIAFVHAARHSGFPSSVSFPQLGCGRGGLGCQDMQSTMERHLSFLPLDITVHLA